MIDTQLRRRIGRLTKEQIAPLLEVIVTQREQPGECPDCQYIGGNNWRHCTVYEALAQSGPALQIHRALRAHERECPDCVVESQWRELYALCGQCQEWNDLFHLYHRRLGQIEHAAQVRRFQEAHGRAPYNPLELVEWLDKEREQNEQS